MKGNLGHYLTLLGFCALVFYGLMLASGNLSAAAMPQFAITAVIFLTAGRMMRRVRLGGGEDDATDLAKPERETDWPWMTALLNWTAALLLIAVMAILLMKPTDLSLREAFSFSTAHKHFFAGAVP